MNRETFIGLLFLISGVAGCATGRFNVGDCVAYSNSLEFPDHMIERIETKGPTGYNISYMTKKGQWYYSALILEYEWEDDFEIVSCPKEIDIWSF